MKRIGSNLVGAVVGVGMALFAFPSPVIAQGVPQQIAALQARMTEAEARLGSAEARLSSAETRLSSAETRLSAAESFASALATENATQASQIAALQAEVVPVGTIITYSAETPPAGYLECDGNPVLRADYPNLFAVIGTAFGEGDGSSTFKVPDLRGLFLRGWSHDSPSGFDPDRTARVQLFPGGAFGDHVGSFQGSQLQDHAHSVNSAALNVFGVFSPVAGGNASGFAQGSTGGVFGGGSETRPRNVSVMYAIKY